MSVPFLVPPRRFTDLAIGMSAEHTKTIDETDVVQFAEVTGDLNPLHLDESAARRTRFGGRIAHGMLSGGLISAAIAMQLPGPGSIYLSQSLRFTRPVRLGDTVTARVVVTALLQEKRRVTLSTTCLNQRGETVTEGEAVVLFEELEP